MPTAPSKAEVRVAWWISGLILAVCALVFTIIVAVAQAVDDSRPDIYSVASPVLVATETPDGRWASKTLADTDLPVVSDGEMPIAFTSCTYVDEPVVTFDRTWKLLGQPDTPVVIESATFPVQRSAGECTTASGSLTVPDDVLAWLDGSNDPVTVLLTWHVEPEGGVESNMATEPFLLAGPCCPTPTVNIDRTAEVIRVAATLETP
jgi:hypothetical protein